MLFNSFEFLLGFLPLALVALHYARRHSSDAAMLVLVVASFIFYSWWDIRYTPILVCSLAFNYWFGTYLRTNRVRLLLVVGILSNLAPLVFWKYARWITGELGEAAGPTEIPLGISFFTFLQISYLVEIYRDRLPPSSPLPYLTFVTYFPHLIAGPILQYEEMRKQFSALGQTPVIAPENVARGWFLLAVGLFKKVIVADQLCAPFVGPVFGSAETVTFYEAWMGSLAYTLQLYFDFSGYCEMAMGMSLLMGISIPVNFLSPYKAANIAEFWRMWHCTLGRWFREYVYIPLGGSRVGVAHTCLALFVTMVLAGAWHGAGWTFIVWGLIHGGMLIAHRIWRTVGLSMPRTTGMTLTMIGVMFGWVVFRADSVSDAMHIWGAMIGVKGFVLPLGFDQFAAVMPSWILVEESTVAWGTEIFLLFLLLLFCMNARNVHEIPLTPAMRRSWVIGGCAVASGFYLASPSTFLYFQF
jgi:alginate O-acetyltransferase complex protein AlgI